MRADRILDDSNDIRDGALPGPESFHSAVDKDRVTSVDTKTPERVKQAGWAKTKPLYVLGADAAIKRSGGGFSGSQHMC